MIRSHRRASLTAASAIALCAICLSPSATSATPVASVPADFDHDGRSELVVQVAGEGFDDKSDAGVVQVLPGSSSGVSAGADQLWSQDSPGVRGTADTGDMFGYSWAECDFDGDHYDDLAVGVVEDDVSGAAGAGAVHVLYGGPDGITAAGDQYWTQDSNGVQETAEEFDTFGDKLAAGDFDGDGECDLAIGVPRERVDGKTFAGTVHVLYGSPSGLTSAGDQLWTQDSTGMQDEVEAFDFFGSQLATGDFDADGYADLVIGMPWEEPSAMGQAGAVVIIYGTSTGLTSAGNQLWHQDIFSVTDTAEAEDLFGSSVVVGDFDGNGFDDLAIGIYGEETGVATDAGAVYVLSGSAPYLTSTGSVLITQMSDGIPGVDEDGDQFGETLAAGDFDGDGKDDLAIGAPSEDLTGTDEGAVTVIYGGATILSGTAELWAQSSPGVPNSLQSHDKFGWYMHTGDFDGNGRDDLVISVPGENTDGLANVGGVHVLRGTGSGLTGTDSRFWDQDSPGVKDSSQKDDNFGSRAM